jgi:hypothetical protein
VVGERASEEATRQLRGGVGPTDQDLAAGDPPAGGVDQELEREPLARQVDPRGGAEGQGDVEVAAGVEVLVGGPGQDDDPRRDDDQVAGLERRVV